HRTITGSRQGFTASPDLYTEAYLNFGLKAVLLIPVLAMLILSLVDFARTRTLEGSALKVAFITVLAFISYRSPIAQASIVIPCVVAGVTFFVVRSIQESSGGLGSSRRGSAGAQANQRGRTGAVAG